MSPPISVAILEDEEDVRDSLAFLFNHTPGYQCVAACPDATQALSQLPPLSPDVILIDITLPGEISGLDCLVPLRQALPNAHLVMLTNSESREDIFRAFQLGAIGYLRKTTRFEELPECVRVTCEGGGCLTPDIARLIAESFRLPPLNRHAAEALTAKEMEVIELLAQGYDPNEIAYRLHITPETMKSHRQHIYQKLHTRSRGQAVAKAYPGKEFYVLPRRVSDDQGL